MRLDEADDSQTNYGGRNYNQWPRCLENAADVASIGAADESMNSQIERLVTKEQGGSMRTVE